MYRFYEDLAPYWHLLSEPTDYAEEAGFAGELLASVPDVREVLELGSGGGNNALHLRSRFNLTLVDLSESMLAVSQTINPDLPHHLGDMRTVRLGRTFDAVFVHDAVMYMTTEADLRSVIETAAVHAAPSGVVLLVPDTVRETFAPGIDQGGHDGDDGRALRYLEWTYDPDPDDTTFEVDFAVVLHEPDATTRVVHDHHTFGLFTRDVWLRLLSEAGLDVVEVDVEHPYPGEFEVFAARRAA